MDVHDKCNEKTTGLLRIEPWWSINIAGYFLTELSRPSKILLSDSCNEGGVDGPVIRITN
jgi:hypothetical protein